MAGADFDGKGQQVCGRAVAVWWYPAGTGQVGRVAPFRVGGAGLLYAQVVAPAGVVRPSHPCRRVRELT